MREKARGSKMWSWRRDDLVASGVLGDIGLDHWKSLCIGIIWARKRAKLVVIGRVVRSELAIESGIVRDLDKLLTTRFRMLITRTLVVLGILVVVTAFVLLFSRLPP